MQPLPQVEPAEVAAVGRELSALDRPLDAGVDLLEPPTRGPSSLLVASNLITWLSVSSA